MIARERDEAERAAWRAEHAALDPAALVFLDETGTPTTLALRRAHAPRGQRAVGRVPQGRWHAVTLLASLTRDGVGASVVLPGALDRDAVDTYVAELLAPALRPGQVVVLGTLSVHTSVRARRLIEAAGCRLRFLPRSSPDLNPIELACAKLQQALRRAEARSVDALVVAIGAATAAVTPADARAFFAAAGYPTTGHLL